MKSPKSAKDAADPLQRARGSAVEKLGTAPLQPYLAKIAGANTRGALVDLFATPGFDSPVGIFIYPDLKDPTHYSAYASQGGLGMPNRDYYLLQGAKYDAFRSAYRNYIIKMLTLGGESDPAARLDELHLACLSEVRA